MEFIENIQHTSLLFLVITYFVISADKDAKNIWYKAITLGIFLLSLIVAAATTIYRIWI